MALALAIAAAGGAGAVLRYLAARLVQRVLGSAFPWGTLFVNVTGCLALGILSGSNALGAPWDRVLGMGLLGGYTTYSTFNYETLALLEERAFLLATLNAAATTVACALAGWVGLIACGAA